MKNYIDVKIKSWGNGSSSGPWVKFDLSDDEELEALKSEVGNSFHMILVPVQEEEEESDNTDCNVVQLKSKRLSQETHLMCTSENFISYLSYLYPDKKINENNAKQWLKMKLGIDSLRELDGIGDDIEQAIDTLEAIKSSFRNWINRK